MVESLKELSGRATPGEWKHRPWVTGNCDVVEEERELTVNGDDTFSDWLSPADAAFICALVNAYRSGQLHDATALAEAEARGYARGLEEAAKVVPAQVVTGEWNALVGPLVQRCEVAAAFGQEAVWNARGADALGQILKHMADVLDSLIATTPAETQKPETGESA